MEAEGLVTSKGVLVEDRAQANRVFNKGRFGIPRSGGGLLLSHLEALYLIESKGLTIRDRRGKTLSSMDLLGMGMEEDPRFDVIYLVYRALRLAGLITLESSPLDLRVHIRGPYDPRSPARYFVEAVAERDLFDLERVKENVTRIERIKREYIMALADEEGDVTYYHVASTSPTGKRTMPDIAGLRKEMGRPARGYLGQDRVLVPSERGGSVLHSMAYYGKPVGDELLLSLVEALYLVEEGALVLQRAIPGHSGNVSASSLKELAAESQPDLPLRSTAYRDLREKGLIVKTGFKYGAHFRVYQEDPAYSHSEYLIHAVDWNMRCGWADMSRGIRLAHGVRKDLVLAAVKDGVVLDYIALKRKKL